MERLAETRRGIGRTSRKQQGEGVLVWADALQAHLFVEREANVEFSIRRVGFDELVVERDCWLGNKVEEGVSIWEIWDLEELQNEVTGLVYAISKRVSMNLL